MPRSKNEIGIFLSFSGYTVWVIADSFIKLAAGSMTSIQITAINFLVGMIFLIGMASAQGGWRQLKSKHPWHQLASSILTLIAVYGSILGVIYLSLADFYTIVFMGPLIATMLAALFLKEKVNPSIWFAIIFGFLGVIVAVRFAGITGHALSWIGIAVTSLASFAYALSQLVVRIVPGENNLAFSFWPRIGGLLAAMIFLFCQKQALHWDMLAILYCILAGILSGLGGLLSTLSLRYAPVAVVSPYHYTQIIGGAAIGYIVWHHIPAPSVAIGAAMVTVSGLYILHRQQLAAQTLLREQI